MWPFFSSNRLPIKADCLIFKQDCLFIGKNRAKMLPVSFTLHENYRYQWFDSNVCKFKMTCEHPHIESKFVFSPVKLCVGVIVFGEPLILNKLLEVDFVVNWIGIGRGYLREFKLLGMIFFLKLCQEIKISKLINLIKKAIHRRIRITLFHWFCMQYEVNYK